ncbi:MAG: bifunctional riboflavin kinase/FAD synthetase [Epulopiscium sp.]|nr:bifunctional riboflavin kinase/FAD synthetase [Candidatus Epulonipiscium sp.]
MKYISNVNISQNLPSVITLGNFDGIHLGHRKLINTVKKVGEDMGLQSIIFSFYPHPQIVLNKGNFPGMIFSRNEKKKRLEEIGIDTYIEHPFTKEFANISPEEFVEKILIKELNTKIIVIGTNNKFGKKQKGDIHFLREREKQWGISVIEMTPVLYDNAIVSSTRVREELLKGNIEKVNELLEVSYSIIGKIVKGRNLGHKLGYPTANILPYKDRIYPPEGVFITRTKYKAKVYNSVTNIGFNPTVNGKVKNIETHMIDFNKSIYDEEIEVEFHKWIRKEQKFSNLQGLMSQLKLDVNESKRYFENW